MSDKIEVVSAAVVQTGTDGVKRLLMTQRAESTSYSFAAVTPGGKTENGETHADTIDREMREECGDDARLLPGGRVVVYKFEVTSSRTGGRVLVTCYLVNAAHGAVFIPQDATIGVWWFDAAMLRVLPMGPADSANREKLVGLVL